MSIGNMIPKSIIDAIAPFCAEIALSEDNWWKELETADLPVALKDMLKGLIGATRSNCIPPRATDHLIALAKHHLKDGVCIHTRTGPEFYNVMLDIPPNLDTHTIVFRLYRTVAGGRLENL